MESFVTALKAGDFFPADLTERAWQLLDARPTAQEPGRLGDFEILNLLACGGMGVVFEGRDPSLNRKVAIKVPLPQFASEEAARERLWKEAQVVASLDHAHIVPVYSVHRHQGVAYFVMPLVAGKNLTDHVGQHGPLNTKQAATLVCQAAQGLAAAHAKGIVHRDIKPANLLLEEDRVRIADFGIASDTVDPTCSGTPGYIAPEQAEGASVKAAADVYSLGASLSFLLTGKPPAPEVGLPKHWLGLLAKRMMDADPASRPTAAEVAHLLGKKLRSRRASFFLYMLVGAAAVMATLFSLTPLGITGRINRVRAEFSSKKFHIEGLSGTYESLLEAAQAAEGRVIYADFDGEMGLNVTDFGNFPVSIKAPENRKPVFRQDNIAARMLVSKALLQLDGITLLRTSRDLPDPRPLAQTINAPLVLKNCRILITGETSANSAEALRLTGHGQVLLEQCEIQTGKTPWLALRRFRDRVQSDASKIQVHHCLIQAGPMTIEPSANFQVESEFSNSTLIGGVLFALHRNGEAQVRFESRDCRFEFSDCLLWLSPENSLATRRYSWQDRGSDFQPTGSRASFLRTGPGENGRSILSSEEWRRSLTL
jgi:predicted Ser/Thr protein kinase